jgi:adenosylcobinamide-GDP ribazoletransferase
LGLAALIALLLIGAQALVPAVCAGLVVGVLALVAQAKIGGQTGDILGAAQQLAEIAFLLALTAQL